MYYIKEKNKIETVTECENGFMVSTQDRCFLVRYTHLNGKVPKPGDVIALYLQGGSFGIGMDLNDEILYLKTEEQLEQERQEWLANREREKQEQFEKNKDAMDVRFNALPKLLQHRLAMYRMFNENFRKDEENYEECAIRIGYKIFLISENEEDVKKFADLDYQEQVKQIPEIDKAGMSTNQLDFAYHFAKGLLEDAKTIDINNPQIDKLVDCFAMMIPNARSPLSGHRCFPRETYVKRYIKTL